jgi:hypothetical protein
MGTTTIEYQFRLPDKTILNFPVVLEQETLQLCENKPDQLPHWAELEYHRCPNCPASFSGEKYCPVASALSTLVTKFETLLSFDTVHLSVYSDAREVRQETTIQRAVASYMGLVMATCGCPNTIFLRPMARYHLPLASEPETIYRAFSMYALAQCFVRMEGKESDDNFQGLQEHYAKLQVVNKALVDRLRAASKSDSSVNALLNLDVYARAMPYVIEDSLEEMRYIFTPYLKE